MGHGPPITDEERGRIKGLHEAGLGVRAIVRRVERSTTAVGNAINARSSGEKKMGHPPSLTDRQVRQIVRAAATGDYSAAELKSTYELGCAVRTIQRLLSKVDFLVYSKMGRTL
ncbi:hypothetical protein PI125_g22634 [Phytophthora idaei]|nr:hypothetical protein PI125_g22634 [Phytophthora idaei]